MGGADLSCSTARVSHMHEGACASCSTPSSSRARSSATPSSTSSSSELPETAACNSLPPGPQLKGPCSTTTVVLQYSCFFIAALLSWPHLPIFIPKDRLSIRAHLGPRGRLSARGFRCRTSPRTLQREPRGTTEIWSSPCENPACHPATFAAPILPPAQSACATLWARAQDCD